MWLFIYAGPKAEAESLLKPFDLLDSVAVEEGNTPYTKVSDILFSGLDSPLCAPNKTHIIGTAGLQTYNIPTQRKLFDLFNKKIAENPRLSDTRLVHEGYSVAAVRDGNNDGSAFPLRDDYLLM